MNPMHHLPQNIPSMFLILFILILQQSMGQPSFQYSSTITLNESVGTINDLVISADNAVLVAGSQDGNTYIYRVNSQMITYSQTLRNQGAIYDIEITPDHQWIASGTKEGILQLYHNHNGTYALQQTIQYHGQLIQFSFTSCTFSQNGTMLIVGQDLYLYVYQRVEGQYLQIQRLRVGFVQSQLAISHDHMYIYQAQLTQHLKTLIWNNHTLQYQRLSRFYFYNRTVRSDKKISLNSDGTVLALASQLEKLLYLIDVSVNSEPKLIAVFEYQHQLTDVTFSDDLLVSSSVNSIQIYTSNGTNFSLIQTIDDGMVQSVAISPDGRFLYVGRQASIYLYSADSSANSPEQVKVVEQEDGYNQQQQQVDLILLYVSLVPISMFLALGVLVIYCECQERRERRSEGVQSNKNLNDRNE